MIAGVVCRGERIRDADDHRQHLTPRALALDGPVSKRAAIDQLSHQILAPIDLAGFVHCQDVRVIECGRHLRFLLEAPPRGRCGEVVRRET